MDFLTKPVDRQHLLSVIDEFPARDRQNAAAFSDEAAVCEQIATLTPREHGCMTIGMAATVNKQVACEPVETFRISTCDAPGQVDFVLAVYTGIRWQGPQLLPCPPGKDYCDSLRVGNRHIPPKHY